MKHPDLYVYGSMQDPFLAILFIYKISLSVMGQAAICKLLETYTFSSVHNLHNKKTKDTMQSAISKLCMVISEKY
jgi:hypothetical protein